MEALFKSWFADFDPVRAKMKGHDTGLPLHRAQHLAMASLLMLQLYFGACF